MNDAGQALWKTLGGDEASWKNKLMLPILMINIGRT
jgi:hypothetical protein